MFRGVLHRLSRHPLQYSLIPVVAAGVGWGTNWMGVKMLFYPIDYLGTEWYREENCPYGLVGWQGVVPARTERMAKRLRNEGFPQVHVRTANVRGQMVHRVLAGPFVNESDRSAARNVLASRGYETFVIRDTQTP